MAGVTERQIACETSRKQNHKASGIVSDKKAMKGARDQQVVLFRSFC